jgi:hypothetical protein
MFETARLSSVRAAPGRGSDFHPPEGTQTGQRAGCMLHPGIMPYGNMRYLMLGKSEVSEIHGLTGIS